MDLMDGREKRRSVRTEKKLEVQYWTDDERRSERGTISDISHHGIFIDTSNPLDAGTILNFSFRLSDDPLSQSVKGKGKVNWAEPMLGMGIDFQNLSPVHAGRIKHFVEAELVKTPSS